MKSIIALLLLLFMMLSCSQNNMYQRLSDIEAIVETTPDSALILLRSIQQDDLTDERSRAYYALLLSQTLDKNYIDEVDDSLICLAENYYKSSDDNHKLMLSYYYHGRVCYNAENYPEALCLMIKSFDCAEDLNDYYWKGRIAEQISHIYSLNYHGKEAIHYAKIACDNLVKSRRQPYVNYALLSLARAYNNNGIYDNCNLLSKQLCDSAMAYNDILLLNYSKELLVTSYIGLKDYENAVAIILEIQESEGLSNNLRCLLGISYIELGETAKANEIVVNMQECYTADDLSLAYEVAKRKGDYKTALNFLSQLYDNLDSVFAKSMNQNFSQSLTELHNAEQKKQEEQMRINQIHNIIIFVCLVFIIIIIIIIIMRYKRKLDRNILIAQNLREILHIKEAQYSEAQLAIKKLLASRFEVIDDLCKTIYENKATGLVRKKISIEIEKLVEDFSDNQKIFELEEYINKNQSNLISSFRTDFPNLKEADYLLFLYTSLGFSISAIALFLKEDKIDAIYNRKARLKAKIRKIAPNNVNAYLNALR